MWKLVCENLKVWDLEWIGGLGFQRRWNLVRDKGYKGLGQELGSGEGKGQGFGLREGGTIWVETCGLG